jgi:hypothetical protein
LIFFLLLFSSLLFCDSYHLCFSFVHIFSEVWLLNFLRLQPTYVLVVGGLEFGPFKTPTKILICQHLDDQQGVLRQMALPEVYSEFADDYLDLWGFRDKSFKIQRPLKSLKQDVESLCNRRPVISRSGGDSGVISFLKNAWPEASDFEIQSLLEGRLPWVSNLQDARQWLIGQFQICGYPSLGCQH